MRPTPWRAYAARESLRGRNARAFRGTTHLEAMRGRAARLFEHSDCLQQVRQKQSLASSLTTSNDGRKTPECGAMTYRGVLRNGCRRYERLDKPTRKVRRAGTTAAILALA